MKHPNGYRKPTDAEMQCLPEGTLTCYRSDTWRLSQSIGKDVSTACKDLYAVPTTRKPLFLRPTHKFILGGIGFSLQPKALPDLLLAMEQQLDPLIPQEAKIRALKLAMEKAGYTFP